MNYVQQLEKKGLVTPPSFVGANTHYLVIMGSMAYGVSNDSSDFDLYGFCIPSKHVLFPHLNGHIIGFGQQPEKFEQWQKHHILDQSANAGKGREYDISVYSIVKFFQLCMDNNPNMVDSLFVPERCVTHSTAIGNMVRQRRNIFLHKGCWHKFRGYAYSQMHKMDTKERPEGKRAEMWDKYGYDVKFAYHVIRLLDEVEQILETGTLNLERDRERLKSIRRGEWTIEQIKKHFESEESRLASLYEKSSLPHRPDESTIKKLLFECLEHHYGSLDNAVVQDDEAVRALREVQEVLDKHRKVLE